MSDVQVKIGTVGAKQAQSDLAQVGKAGREAESGARSAGKGLDRAAPAAGQAAKGFQAMSAAASASSGSVQGMAAAMGQMLPQLKGLQSALPAAGMALAAFSAWKKVFDEIQRAARETEDALRKIQVGNLSAQVEGLAAAYGRLSAAIKETNDEQTRTLANEQALADAVKKKDLAENELWRQRGLRSAKTDEKRQEVEARYDISRARIEAGAAAGDVGRRGAMVEVQAETAEAERTAARDRVRELSGQEAALQQRFAAIRDQQNKTTGDPGQLERTALSLLGPVGLAASVPAIYRNIGTSPRTEQKNIERLQPDLDKVLADLGKVSKQLEDAVEAQRKAEARVEDLGVARRVASLDAAATVATQRTQAESAVAAAAAVTVEGQDVAGLRARLAEAERRARALSASAQSSNDAAAAALEELAAQSAARAQALGEMLRQRLERINQAQADLNAKISSIPIGG